MVAILVVGLVGAGALFTAYLVTSARVAAEVDRLAPGLEAPDRADRVAAAVQLTTMLGGLGAAPLHVRGPAIMDVLVDGFESIDPAIRSDAAEALARWGALAEERIRTALRSEDDYTRILAAWTASLDPLPDLIPTLRDAVRDRRVEVRVYAIDALGRMRLNQVDEELLADIVYRLWKDTHRDRWPQNAAAEAMWRLGFWTGIPLLVRNMRNDARFWTRFDAYRRLARIYAKRGITLPAYDASAIPSACALQAAAVRDVVYSDAELLRRLIDNLALVKYQLFMATKWSLTEMGKYAVPALVAALDHSVKHARVGAAETLAILGEPATPAVIRDEALPALREIARPAFHKVLAAGDAIDIDEALYAMRALGAYGDADDVAVLIAHAGGENPDLAMAAIENLGRIGGDAARKALESLKVTDERETERQRALKRIGAKGT